MVSIKVNFAEVQCEAKGTRILVSSEILTAIDTLRDNVAKCLIISREKATEMVIESLADSLLIKE